MKDRGVTGESIPAGWIVSKTKRIKVLEIHSGSMELSFRALPSDSCQAAIQSVTQRETAGHGEEGVKRWRQRAEETDRSAGAMLTGQWSQSEVCVLV